MTDVRDEKTLSDEELLDQDGPAIDIAKLTRLTVTERRRERWDAKEKRF